jgi:hypothetical protein
MMLAGILLIPGLATIWTVHDVKLAVHDFDFAPSLVSNKNSNHYSFAKKGSGRCN